MTSVSGSGQPIGLSAGSAAGARPVQSQSFGAAPGPLPSVALDPFKLLNKYKYILAGSAVVGLVLGVVVFLLLLKLSPVWTSRVLFECYTPSVDVQTPVGVNPGEQATELERFMQTQVRQMVSETVLQRAATDPRLVREAPSFAERFTEAGGLNTSEVVAEFTDKARSRAVPLTKLMELSYSDSKPENATAIVKLIKEAYQANLQTIALRANKDQADEFRKDIARLQTEIQTLQTRRDNKLKSENVTSVDSITNDVFRRIETLQFETIRAKQELDQVESEIANMQAKSLTGGVIQYDDRIVNEVENDPLIVGIKTDINAMRTAMDAFLRKGTREHREYRSMENRLAGLEQSLNDEKGRLLQQKFEANFQLMLSRQGGLKASLATMEADLKTQLEKQQQLTRTIEEIQDIQKQLTQMQESLSERQTQLSNITIITQLPTATRVVVAQNEQMPREISFPSIKLIVPASMLVVVGLTAGAVLLRELIDQRIKGPADVAVLPRTRVLGWIPDADEDPVGKGSLETAFRDRPRGVIAETFRNLRGSVVKRMQMSGHRSLTVVGGMPGSGATSMVTNLAMAASAADLRVLVIDANFRRPGIHRVFGLNAEAPGLSDVLTGQASLKGAVQRVSSAPSDAPSSVALAADIAVLTVGTKSSRRLELLSTEALSTVLATARAEYDLILVDTAPALVASDGLALANRTDASMLVVRALSEKRGMVARLRNDLSEARGEFLGIVVNGVKSAAGGYLKGNIRATHEYSNDAA